MSLSESSPKHGDETRRENRRERQLRDALERPARDNLLAYLPKRTLTKVVFLLVLLAAVIYFKRRTDLVLRLVEPTMKSSTPSSTTPQSVPSSRR